MSFFDVLDELTVIAATAAEETARWLELGNHGTAGPEDHPGVLDVVHAEHPKWSDGFWSGALKTPAHVRRVGGPINPYAVVVHTTDMVPEDWNALVRAWTTQPGDGACAHFLIGRAPHDGVLQFASINRNGNHAGGPGHGVFDTARAKNIHPNLITVGIELHCAGGVRRIGEQWRLVENGKACGAPLPDADVVPDPIRPGRGYHVVTDFQREQLAALLDDLEHVLAAAPEGLASRSLGEAVPTWGVPRSARVVGHVSLDPADRSDPWPLQMQWVNARAG